MKIAVIDIGSNSIRYMEAELTEAGFGFSDKSVYTTRLASGLINSGILSDESMQASIDVLRMLAERAKSAHLPCYCYATSAVRDAKNRNSFLSRVSTSTGLTIQILSGEDEALFARIGANETNGGLIDIGGGSSQVITESFRQSFPLGCVRIRDLCGGCDLASMQQILTPVFEKTYSVLPAFPALSWTAVGGTATTIAALSLRMQTYVAKRIRDACVSQGDLSALLLELEEMGDFGRAAHPLLTQRYDVIRGGGLILLHLMQRIGIDAIHFSDADGLEGYAMQILSSN